jgi:hypothetical protein
MSSGDGLTIRFTETVSGHNAGDVAVLSRSSANRFISENVAVLIAGANDSDGLGIRFVKTVPGHNAGDTAVLSRSSAQKFIAEGSAVSL